MYTCLYQILYICAFTRFFICVPLPDSLYEYLYQILYMSAFTKFFI